MQIDKVIMSNQRYEDTQDTPDLNTFFKNMIQGSSISEDTGDMMKVKKEIYIDDSS